MKRTPEEEIERYEACKARVVAGEGSDDDARLVKLYERQGYVAGRRNEGRVDDPAATERGDEGSAEGSEDEDEDAGVGEPVDYANLSRDELKAIAAERGLDIKGKQAAQVVKLLQEYDAEQAEQNEV